MYLVAADETGARCCVEGKKKRMTQGVVFRDLFFNVRRRHVLDSGTLLDEVYKVISKMHFMCLDSTLSYARYSTNYEQRQKKKGRP